MKQNSLLLALALVLSGIGIASFASADQPTSQVTFCVDWATKQVRYSNSWQGKCPNKMSPLVLSEQGPAGPAGPAGATGSPGAVGATGSAGAAGTAFNLSQYPVLNQLENKISSVTCDKKWNAIHLLFGQDYFQEENEFGQPISNKQWALDLAGNCPYIYPLRFLEPRVSRVSDFVFTSSASPDLPSSSARPYMTPYSWKAGVSSMKIAFTNLRGFSFCKPSDPQYAAFSMTQNTYWSESATAEIQYRGPSFNFRWYKGEAEAIPDSARGGLEAETALGQLYFCGVDASTSSGLGVRKIDLTGAYNFGPQWVAVKP